MIESKALADFFLLLVLDYFYPLILVFVIIAFIKIIKRQ